MIKSKHKISTSANLYYILDHMLRSWLGWAHCPWVFDQVPVTLGRYVNFVKPQSGVPRDTSLMASRGWGKAVNRRLPILGKHVAVKEREHMPSMAE